MKRLAITAVVMLIVAACSEHLPRALDEAAPATLSDASSDAALVQDASDEASIADASIEASDITDAAVEAEAEASGPPIGDAANCNVRLASPPLPSECNPSCPHVAQGTSVTYTNPPSGGPHYPVWANFQEFSTVVPDGNLVHSLEHGAVELFYNCNAADAACAKIIADLRAVRAAIATDPQCDSSIRVRIIIAPRPASDTVVSASAWGQTYRADCVDIESLKAWVTANYAHSPEDLCFAGQTAF